ncbi:MAG TPA: hypothetical protein VGJ82_12125 [Thermoanaerobaculia bacterium]
MRPLGRFFVLLALLLDARGAFACSCIHSPLPKQIERSADVFVGVVERVDAPFGRTYPDVHNQQIGINYGRKTTLSVVKSIKGIAHDHYEVWSAYGGGDCGIEFKVGLTYLVFARDLNGVHITFLCDGTRWIGCDDRGQIAELTGMTVAPDAVYDENFPCVAPPLLIGDRDPELERNEKYKVNLTVDKEGNVTNFYFLTPACTPECLARRAGIERTIRNWRFMPAELNGNPVAYRFHELSRLRVQTTTEMRVWR